MSRLVSVETPAPGIVRIVLNAPPDNALTAGMRADLDAALDAALGAQGIRAVLLAGRGASFCSGPLSDREREGQSAPGLAAICARLDAATVPVVAALQGEVRGPGVELALAAHYRLALRQARLRLDGVAVGLPPSAGTTQRLPRLTRPETALDLLLTGRPLDAARAQRQGLVDAVTDADLDAAALRFVAGLLERRAGPRPAPSRPLPPFEGLHEAVARHRATLDRDSPDRAPALILDCVEAAALLPYEAALAYEAAAFEDCADGPVHRALLALVTAERRLGAAARAAARDAPAIGTVGLWGWGPEAASLAAGLLAAGVPVRMGAPQDAALTDGIGETDVLLTAAQVAGRLEDAARDAAWNLFSGVTGPGALQGCDMIIEAGTGAWEARARVFPELAAAAKAGAVLLSTGALGSASALGAAGGRLADALWLHLPEIAPGADLAELVCTPETSAAARARAAALARRIGRMPLQATEESPVRAVFLGGLEAADALVEDGASPYLVDAAMRAWGFAEGPYEMADRLGLENMLALRARLPDGDDPGKRPILLAGQVLAEGRLGRAEGLGYYAYPAPDGPARPDPGLGALVDAARRTLGKSPAEIAPAAIQARVVAGMAQAGAGLLRRGAVRRAAEIDLAVVHALGLARWRGGPMRAADEVGLLALRRVLLGLAARPGGAAIWSPDPLILDLVKTGRHFGEWRAEAPALSPA